MATNISRAHELLAASLLSDARELLGTEMAFGDRKVFLAGLLGPVPGQDMTELDELRHAGLLVFARADLVAAMDPALVAASTWAHPDGPTYHFLVVE